MLLGASDDLLGGIELGEVVAEEQRAENGGAEELEQVGGRHAVVVVVVESGEDENRTTVYSTVGGIRSGRVGTVQVVTAHPCIGQSTSIPQHQ